MSPHIAMLHMIGWRISRPCHQPRSGWLPGMQMRCEFSAVEMRQFIQLLENNGSKESQLVLYCELLYSALLG